MIKGSIHQEDTIILNMHAFYIRLSLKYIKQTDRIEARNHNTKVDFNTPLSVIGSSIRQMIKRT